MHRPAQNLPLNIATVFSTTDAFSKPCTGPVAADAHVIAWRHAQTIAAHSAGAEAFASMFEADASARREARAQEIAAQYAFNTGPAPHSPSRARNRAGTRRPEGRVMLRTIAEELAALASLCLFLGMLMVWAAAIATS